MLLIKQKNYICSDFSCTFSELPKGSAAFVIMVKQKLTENGEGLRNVTCDVEKPIIHLRGRTER